MIDLKDNNITHDARLDRIPQFDQRSRNFPIRKLLADIPPRSYTWSCPVWLNQHREGACVGFAFSHEAIARPVKVPDVTESIARDVYHHAQMLDEWPGEEEEGTSVLGGAKACVQRGWYREYRWAFGLTDVVDTLGYHGPVVLGVNWYTGMMETNSIGHIKASGSIEGGHAILACAVHIKRRTVRLHNSWGTSWGLQGDCYIGFDDLERILIEQGEACVPLGRHK